MDDHSFCKGLLKNAREMAKEAGVKIPAITSYKTGCGQYQLFIAGRGDGPFVSGHCSFDAKAKWIIRQIPDSETESAT
jgi:hypothetical protein